MAVSVDNKSIKIPEKQYVGFQKRGDNEVPLGFMTPDGEDQAAIKRKTTVDNWASGHGWGANKQVTLPAKSYENKPLTGFKLGKNVRHGYGWGQGTVKWRMEDPRGFELEISSPNLAQILSMTTIENGEILEKCVWARLGNENILLPVNSDVYKTAAANTERMGKKASLRDLKPGDYVVLVNGTEGTYYGNLFPVHDDRYGLVEIGDKKRHMIATDVKGALKLELSASLKVAEIREGDRSRSAEDYARELNDKLGTEISGGHYQTVIAVSTKKVTNVKYSLKPITVAAARAMTDQPNYLVAKKDERFGMVQTWYMFNPHRLRTAVEATEFYLDKLLEKGELDYITKMSQPPAGHSSWWYRSRPVEVHFTADINDVSIEWFVISREFETNDGVKVV